MRAAAAALLILLLSIVASLAQSPVSVIGPVAPGHCVSFFSTTQIQDAGGACAGVASVTGTAGQITVSPTTGAVVVGLVTPVSLANGGTNNAALTASAGGIVWSDATKLNILAGTVTAGQCLMSGSSAAPSWGSCGSGGGVVASVGNAAADTSLTIAGTGTGPWTGAVTAKINLANAQTWTAAQTFANSDILLRGSSTGTTTFTSANAGASNFTLTFPAVTANLGYLVGTPVTGNCVKFSGTVGGITDSGGVCGGGGGTPGGASGSIQYNNAAAFGGFGFTNGTSLTALGNGATAQQFLVYNIVDTLSAPVNFERAAFDFTTTANTLTVGTQAGGTGTLRAVTLNGVLLDLQNSGTLVARILGNVVDLGSHSIIGSQSGVGFGGSGFSVKAPLVWAFGNGSAGDSTGWMAWGGEARVTADFSVTSSTTLVNVTGLSVNVQAGRTYQFVTELYVTDAAAGGVQAAIAGTATATAIQYVGFAIADNAIKAKTNATALATAVASTVTTETAGIIVRITGTITVNAAGTLTVQMAQNTSNATPTIAKRGSWLLVNDMP